MDFLRQIISGAPAGQLFGTVYRDCFVFPTRLGQASEPHPWEAEEVEADD